MNLGANLCESTLRGRSLLESQTFCPGRRVGAGLRQRLARCCCSCEDLRSAARAFLHTLRHRWTRCWAAGTPTSDFCSENKGGWNPYWHSKGDIPIEEWRRVLCANSAQIRCLLQCVGLDETRHLKVASISWLVRSVCPLDWGWNPDDRLAVAPISWQKAFQNLDANWGPRSDTTSWGKPCNLKTCCSTISAVCGAEGSFGKGISWQAFENLSTTTKIPLLPWEVGRPITKSIEICDHGRAGTGRGSSRPCGRDLESLCWAQMEQAAT